MPGTVFGGIFLGFRFRLPEGCGPSGQAQHQAWQACPACARPAMALLRGGGGREKREKEKGGGKKKKGGKGKKINSVSLYVS